MFRMRALLPVLFLLSACTTSEPGKQVVADENGAGYFSIIDFTKDQWATYHGQPFSINKKVTFNGKIDSSLTNAIDVNWGSVFKTVFETDISSTKYLDKYQFTQFDDATTRTKNYYYEAKDTKLYTRKLHIMTDYYTDRITSIYIEAEKGSRMGTKSVKVFYTPTDVLSIQELETSKTGERKELKVEYDFM